MYSFPVTLLVEHGGNPKNIGVFCCLFFFFFKKCYPNFRDSSEVYDDLGCRRGYSVRSVLKIHIQDLDFKAGFLTNKDREDSQSSYQTFAIENNNSNK